MKKILALITACALTLLALAACTNETDESSAPEAESSAFEQSNVVSKPWYDTSVPESYSSQAPDYSSAESSVPDISLPESEASIPEAESSSPESGSLGQAINGISLRDAKGHRIAFTKESALNATICVTNTEIAVTAIFDGAITRFFGAVKGEYYTSLYGKFISPCHEGFYDVSSGDEGRFVEFTFDKDNGAFISVNEILHGHGGYYSMPFYSSVSKKAYVYYRDEEGEELFVYEHGAGAAICRELKGDYDVEANWKNGSLELQSADLGKYGLVEDGRVVIPFEYDNISTYNSESDLAYGNSVGVVLAEKDGRCYYISTNGNILTPEGFDCGSQPFGDRAWVFEDGQGWILEFN